MNLRPPSRPIAPGPPPIAATGAPAQLKDERLRLTPPREQESTRTRIVQAAYAVFVSHGYAGATIRAIAEQANVSRATVYHLVGGKAELLRDVYTALGAAPPTNSEMRGTVAAARSTVDPLTAARAWATRMTQRTTLLEPLRPVLVEESEVAVTALAERIDTDRLNETSATAQLWKQRGWLLTDLSHGIDVLWALSSPHLLQDFKARGWAVERYVSWLADTASRSLLLADQEPIYTPMEVSGSGP